ncbi:MAG: hypothetical protein ACI4RD_07845 [Kiritimatiellia bacterium]
MPEQWYVAVIMANLRIDDSGNFTENISYGWESGWIAWEIPFGWTAPDAVREDSMAVPMQIFDPVAGHRFEITAEGLVTVRKFGNYAQRDINNNINCNGVPCGRSK